MYIYRSFLLNKKKLVRAVLIAQQNTHTTFVLNMKIASTQICELCYKVQILILSRILKMQIHE